MCWLECADLEGVIVCVLTWILMGWKFVAMCCEFKASECALQRSVNLLTACVLKCVCVCALQHSWS